MKVPNGTRRNYGRSIKCCKCWPYTLPGNDSHSCSIPTANFQRNRCVNLYEQRLDGPVELRDEQDKIASIQTPLSQTYGKATSFATLQVPIRRHRDGKAEHYFVPCEHGTRSNSHILRSRMVMRRPGKRHLTESRSRRGACVTRASSEPHDPRRLAQASRIRLKNSPITAQLGQTTGLRPADSMPRNVRPDEVETCQ